MHRRSFTAALAAAHFTTAPVGAALLAALPGAAASQERFPSRPLRFIVPASAGGPSDVVARIVAEKLGEQLGQAVVVENKPAASLTLGTAAVAQSNPDGYTLLFTTSTPIVMVPFTMKKPPYDVQRDLVTVSHLDTTPLVLYVNASSAIQSVRQLAEAAKARPEASNYGSYGNGSSAHVLGEMLNKQAGTRMVHVPYKGVAPELQALVAGEITTAVADVGTALPLVKGGRIRPIAVTGSQRSPMLPEVPTFSEQGIAGMEVFSPWWGVFAPQKTPAPVVEQLSAALAKIVRAPDMRERLLGYGIDPSGTGPVQAGEITRTDMARWQAILKEVSYIDFE